MAELVDAPDSKSGIRKDVGVRFPLPVPLFFSGFRRTATMLSPNLFFKGFSTRNLTANPDALHVVSAEAKPHFDSG